MTASTDTSMSSPIMMLWLVFLVRTSIRKRLPAFVPCASHTRNGVGKRVLARLREMAPPMAPRSLRPQLNQIRAWVRQGRTDAWIAHQLEVSVKDLRQFKRDHELEAPEAGESEGAVAPSDDLDL